MKRSRRKILLIAIVIAMSLSILALVVIWTGGGDASLEMQDENQLLYTYPVNTDHAPGVIPPNEHERIAPDCFYISGKLVFIDDAVNNNILVYNEDLYFKTLSLWEYMDVNLMYYDPVQDILKVVYEDRYDEDCTHLYMTNIMVSTGEISSDCEELSNIDNALLEYCFDSEGDLLTQYFVKGDHDTVLESADTGNVKILGEDSEVVRNSVFGVSENATYRILSFYKTTGDESTVREGIVIEKDDQSFMYAIPEMHENALTRGYLEVSPQGRMYQMTVDLSGIKIYQLGSSSMASFADDQLLEREVSHKEIHLKELLRRWIEWIKERLGK